MRKILIATLLALTTLPTAAATKPTDMINGIVIRDGKEYVVTVKMADIMPPEETARWDSLPAQMVANGELPSGETFRIIFMKTVKDRLTRIVHIGNRGTIIGVDYDMMEICTLRAGDTGAMAKKCFDFIADNN